MIQINIEIHKRNRFKEIIHKVLDKMEDIAFSVIQKIPERFITPSMMNWLNRYVDKRLALLQQQIIHDRWYNIELKKAVDKISKRQQG